jgi:hypothetical protein
MSASKGKKRVPWSELQRAQGDYIKRKYLPKQVALKQYYHIRREDADALLRHWTERQAAGKIPLRFNKAIWQKKPVLEENDANDANDDMPVGEEAEEDLQGGDDSQVGDISSDRSAERAHPGQSLGDAADNPSRVS